MQIGTLMNVSSARGISTEFIQETKFCLSLQVCACVWRSVSLCFYVFVFLSVSISVYFTIALLAHIPKPFFCAVIVYVCICLMFVHLSLWCLFLLIWKCLVHSLPFEFIFRRFCEGMTKARLSSGSVGAVKCRLHFFFPSALTVIWFSCPPASQVTSATVPHHGVSAVGETGEKMRVKPLRGKPPFRTEKISCVWKFSFLCKQSFLSFIQSERS